MEMDTEKRLERIEKILLEDEWFARIERRSIRITAFILLVLILTLLVSYGIYEVASFAIRLFFDILHLLRG
jgi:hypothetical protein